MNVKEAIYEVVEGRDLSLGQAEEVMNVIMAGGATDAQVAALLIGLRTKGETVDEITGFASVMRQKAADVRPREAFVIDTCGTGGDSRGTFNISTATAFVAAGAGARVAKHGNRSVSSRCGSADVLEALGVNLNISPADVGACVDEVGIGFLFAPALHAAMRYVMPARKETGVRTVFNILGPLTNPARAAAQVVGVYSPELTETLARVLDKLGTRHALVVHGADDLDELSTTGPTKVCELKSGRIETYLVTPEDVGLPRATLADLAGGSPEANAVILQEILAGKTGPKRDIVLLNAAAALVAAGLSENLRDGVERAAESIDSGRAEEKLVDLIRFTTVKQGSRRAG
jgi:anthranilate phosphoribosyltransferase